MLHTCVLNFDLGNYIYILIKTWLTRAHRRLCAHVTQDCKKSETQTWDKNKLATLCVCELEFESACMFYILLFYTLYKYFDFELI